MAQYKLQAAGYSTLMSGLRLAVGPGSIALPTGGVGTAHGAEGALIMGCSRWGNRQVTGECL